MAYCSHCGSSKTLTQIINEECENFGKKYVNGKGIEYTFHGIFIDQEDYYYYLTTKDKNADFKTIMSSCVGSLASSGYMLKE